MFEGKPPHPPEPVPSVTLAEADTLRPLTWGDLVSRLEAARELRGELNHEVEGDSDGTLASFDSDSARRIARQGKGKEDVNLHDLANGKGAGASIAPADDIQAGTRGNS